MQCRWSANSNGGDLESLGYKEGFRVDVDVPDGTWAEAPHFHDILIFNTGHWYNFQFFYYFMLAKSSRQSVEAVEAMFSPALTVGF